MNAEIDLIAASPDELTALRATLAPREAFTRYGIDRPPFLSTLTFKVGKSKDGRDVLLVRSTEAIPEPFVTFLVEVNWARGRLMREYTVLLDPPVYTPGENASSSAPVTAPTDGRADARLRRRRPAPRRRPPTPSDAARLTRPSPAPPESPPPARSSSAPVFRRAAAGGTASPGTVQVAKGDTLTKIARSLHADTPANIDQTMIAVVSREPRSVRRQHQYFAPRRGAARSRRR